MSAPAPSQSSTLGGPPPMMRTDTIVSAFPIPLLRTSSNASGRPEPTWAPVKGLEPNVFNRDHHNAHELQGRFIASLEAAAHGETAHGETARGETAHNETAHDKTAIRVNPHGVIG